MNKKLLIFGAVAAFGFVLVTAFGGKTKEQQMTEIEDAVEAQLEEYRVELQEACTARVMEEAERVYAEEMAAKGTPTVTRKSGTRNSGPKVDPVPAAPAPEKNDKQKKMSGSKESNAAEKKSKMTAPQETNTAKKKSKMKGGN